MASALNIYAGSWMEAAGPSRLELLVIDLFKQWIGYPEQASGVLVSGGSAANMTALACAREALARRREDSSGDAVAYVVRPGTFLDRAGRPGPRHASRPAARAAQ